MDCSLPAYLIDEILDSLRREADRLPPGRRPKSPNEMNPRCLEASLRRRGFSRLAGVDEAGRGPLAGPVVAAAVVPGTGDPPRGIADSKKLTATQRLRLVPQICEFAAAVGVGVVTEEGIDLWNIRRASEVAMVRAVKAVGEPPGWVLVDGRKLDAPPFRQIAVVKGDASEPAIAMASIIAKSVRDRLMHTFSRLYPVYDFERHKGYPTKEHANAIHEWGICAIHRQSFRVPG